MNSSSTNGEYDDASSSLVEPSSRELLSDSRFSWGVARFGVVELEGRQLLLFGLKCGAAVGALGDGRGRAGESVLAVTLFVETPTPPPTTPSVGSLMLLAPVATLMLFKSGLKPTAFMVSAAAGTCHKHLFQPSPHVLLLNRNENLTNFPKKVRNYSLVHVARCGITLTGCGSNL